MHRFWTWAALAAAVTQATCQTGRAQGPFSGPAPVATQAPMGSPVPMGNPVVANGAPVITDYPQGGVPVIPGTGPVSYSGDWSAVGGPVGLGSGGYDQLYPYDAAEPWVHGYWQDIPSYGGWQYFRPYNYKHVLSQSQVAAGWGMSPTMPYSQELFRRYPPVSPTPISRFATPAPVETVAASPAVEETVAPPVKPGRPSYDEQIYRAELARLRAQRDFDTMHGTAPAADKPESAANVPVRLPPPPKPEVAPTTYTLPSPATNELQARIRQQQRELEALQDALRRETERR